MYGFDDLHRWYNNAFEPFTTLLGDDFEYNPYIDPSAITIGNEIISNMSSVQQTPQTNLPAHVVPITTEPAQSTTPVTQPTPGQDPTPTEQAVSSSSTDKATPLGDQADPQQPEASVPPVDPEPMDDDTMNVTTEQGQSEDDDDVDMTTPDGDPFKDDGEVDDDTLRKQIEDCHRKEKEKRKEEDDMADMAEIMEAIDVDSEEVENFRSFVRLTHILLLKDYFRFASFDHPFSSSSSLFLFVIRQSLIWRFISRFELVQFDSRTTNKNGASRLGKCGPVGRRRRNEL